MAWWGWIFVFVLLVALYSYSLERDAAEFEMKLASKRFYREMAILAEKRKGGGV